MLAILLLPCRATITNQLCACARSQLDWSADYRLYSHERVEPRLLFAQVLARIHQRLPAQNALVVAIDDTLIRKTGVHIDGVGWKRDPLGPKFQTNLVRGQRYLQLSAAWPLPTGAARMLPIAFTHAPSASKPPKNPTPDQTLAHKEEQKQRNLNQVAKTSIEQLRESLPAQRKLIIVGDGGYTNAAIIKNLPPNTTYIGRMRHDAVLHYKPVPIPAPVSTTSSASTPAPADSPAPAPAPPGRPRLYGEQAPSPEALHKDPNSPWRTLNAHAAGKHHDFKIKTSAPLLWRKTGAALPLRLMVIAPLGYRLRKGSKLLYRKAAYLICTDEQISDEEYLQTYLWRWGIEVNFRDEKSELGVGEAQVRTAASNRTAPACAVAAYSFLWLAALEGAAEGIEPVPQPKWRKPKKPEDLGTADLIKALRSEQWAEQIEAQSFSHFKTGVPEEASTQKPRTSLPHTLLSTA